MNPTAALLTTLCGMALARLATSRPLLTVAVPVIVLVPVKVIVPLLFSSMLPEPEMRPA